MNNLKKLRVKHNLTLRQLEKAVHIGNSALSLMENGAQPFRQIHIEKLCKFFNVTPNYLLGNEEKNKEEMIGEMVIKLATLDNATLLVIYNELKGI